MTADALVRDLLSFSIQTALVVVAVAALLRMIAIPARVRYACLRLVLLACLVAPWVLRSTVVITAPPPVAQSAVADVLPSDAVSTHGSGGQRAIDASDSVVPALPWTTLALATLLAGIVGRAVWLAVGLWRLRRLTRRAVAVDDDDYTDVQQRLGTAATIAQVNGLAQPVTFGLRRPVVLLPDTLAGAPAGLRRAVVVHELFHVRRRDWLAVLGEEALKTVLWFHPAILWLTSRIQLVREELVDELTVQATGDRRTYMQALLAFADTDGLRSLDRSRGKPAPAFAHRRQLYHRILSVSKEKVMSVPRVVLSIGLLVAGVCGASVYAATLFPIVDAMQVAARPVEAAARDAADEPQVQPATVISPEGTRRVFRFRPVPSLLLPDQQSASVAVPSQVTPENPIPRRTRGVSPVAPRDGGGAQVVVSARVTVDRDGRVIGVEREACRGSAQWCSAFYDATASAIQQWRYDRPAQAPLQFYVVTTFRPNEEPSVVQSATTSADQSAAVGSTGAEVKMADWLEYVRETQDALRVLADATRQIDATPKMQADLAAVTNRLRELERAMRQALERGMTPAHPDVGRLQVELAELSNALALAQRQLEEASREAAVAVRPTPSGPFDGSPRLVSPSGRAPIRIGGAGLFKAPTVVKSVSPAYSAEAMQARVEGTVSVEVLVDERGRVADARVLKSIPLLDESALAAARQWEFTPSILNGEPVPVLVMLELEFNLRK